MRLLGQQYLRCFATDIDFFKCITLFECLIPVSYETTLSHVTDGKTDYNLSIHTLIHKGTIEICSLHVTRGGQFQRNNASLFNFAA
jgi:hypothetical protein